MIGVGMGDDRSGDSLAGVDEKFTGLTKQSRWRKFEQRRSGNIEILT